MTAANMVQGDATYLQPMWLESQQNDKSGATDVSTKIDASANDAKYKAEFTSGTYQMTEEQFVSLRRAEDGLEPFIPNTPPQAATDVALNPLASELQ